jgi:UDP-N-acetylglucosamine--N-acetylmuramyl-(pentapeptide) pyrophosphoryl-undecaprenol N-acetylglucosamine transferase
LQGFPGTFPAGMSPMDSGNPVRHEVAALPEPQIRFADRAGPIRILVTGGSQGAMVLNQVVPAALALLPSSLNIEVRHQAGAKRVDEAHDAYTVAGVDAEIKPFIDDMAAAYAWADLVICRSGALTVAELAATGVASVLVPYAYAVDDHQTRNAEYLSSANAAVILSQASLDPGSLATVLEPLLSDRSTLLNMACAARRLALPDAAEKVVEACSEWVNS